MKKCHCQRCRYKWLSALPDGPKACAKCNSPYWRIPRRNAKGQGRPKKDAPRCEKCGQVLRGGKFVYNYTTETNVFGMF